MSTKRVGQRILICASLAVGTMLAGPCGITTLQATDFLRSAAIRTTVTTLASVLEAATVDEALESASASTGEEQ